MASTGRIIYLGDDAAYFRVLAEEVKRLAPGKALRIDRLFESQPERIQGLLPRVFAANPALVLVDFSKHTDDFVHLARLLVRTHHPDPFPVVGLHDYLSPADQIKESTLAGVSINHIKSAEVHDPAFGILVLLKDAKEHGFATADLAEDVVATHLCKIGSANERGIHFETHLDINQGQELRMRHHWLREKMIPSGLMTVKRTGSSLLYYNSSRFVDAEFNWLEPMVKSEGDTPERLREIEGDREAAIAKAKKSVRHWIENNADRSQSKVVRVLVVDRAQSFYQNRQRTDTYGYALRCQPYLVDPALELDQQRPQVVAFALDVAGEGGKEKPQPGSPNDMAMVKRVVEFFNQKCADESPYLVVMNLPAGTTSKDLQQELGYAHAIAYDGEWGPDVVLKLAAMYTAKMKAPPVQAGTVVMRKTNPASIGEIEESVKLLKLSETDAVFQCARALPPGTALHFDQPFQGFLTVVQHPQLSKPPVYYALVNGIGEIGKKELRRYVNTLFFKDHDAEKLAELEAYQQLNTQKLTEQQEAARLAAEAAAKEAAEKAAVEGTPAPEPDLPKVSNG